MNSIILKYIVLYCSLLRTLYKIFKPIAKSIELLKVDYHDGMGTNFDFI